MDLVIDAVIGCCGAAAAAGGEGGVEGGGVDEDVEIPAAADVASAPKKEGEDEGLGINPEDTEHRRSKDRKSSTRNPTCVFMNDFALLFAFCCLLFALR